MTIKRNFRLIVSVATRSGISQSFARQIAKLEPYAVVSISGISDVALARNIQLTETEPHWEENAVILLLDDDMDISETEKVIELVNRASAGDVGSGLYVDKNGEPTAGPFPGKPGKWLTGLGVFAIPVKALVELMANTIVVSSRGKGVTCYTASRPILHGEKWEWSSEDYTLSYLLGGVKLHTDLCFGHFKTLPLYPSPNLVEKLNEYCEY